MPPVLQHGRHRSARGPWKAFARQWIVLNAHDLFWMAVVGAVSTLLFVSDVPFTRTFPINFSNTGDVVFPEWAYPYRGWLLPSWLSGLVSIGLPMLVYLISIPRVKSAWDMSTAIMGTVWSVLIATLFQVSLKQLIGGFRPTFLDTCQPDITKLKELARANELNGSGYQKIFYTIDVCTQQDWWKLKHAITSFPSGHSTAAFAGFGFLFLWLNAKLKVWADHRPAFWKLTTTLLPLLVALGIACSLTIDAAHNWYDILAGSLIGIFTSFAAYRSSYAAVWDWRYNHLALDEREAFLYSNELDDEGEYKAQTVTRCAGWGRTKDWLGESSGSYVSRTGVRAARTAPESRIGGNATGEPVVNRVDAFV